MQNALNQNIHRSQTPVKIGRVFYTGSDALNQGIGLKYDLDAGTATALDSDRTKTVEKYGAPSSNELTVFAGITDRAYDAVTGGQWINVYEPGSVAYVRVNGTATVTLGSFGNVYTLDGTSDEGEFSPLWCGGGAGSCRFLQTGTGTDGELVLAELLEGPETGPIFSVTPAAGAYDDYGHGLTYVNAAATIASDMTETFAAATTGGLTNFPDGTVKAFWLAGALTTGDFEPIFTGGVVFDAAGTTVADGHVAGTTFTLDGAGERAAARVVGGVWETFYASADAIRSA